MEFEAKTPGSAIGNLTGLADVLYGIWLHLNLYFYFIIFIHTFINIETQDSEFKFCCLYVYDFRAEHFVLDGQ